jgi:hypothetical protein
MAEDYALGLGGVAVSEMYAGSTHHADELCPAFGHQFGQCVQRDSVIVGEAPAQEQDHRGDATAADGGSHLDLATMAGHLCEHRSRAVNPRGLSPLMDKVILGDRIAKPRDQQQLFRSRRGQGGLGCPFLSLGR